MTTRYELHAYHLYTNKKKLVHTFDNYQDAIRVRDTLDEMIADVTCDSPLQFGNGEPWHLEIVDIVDDKES